MVGVNFFARASVVVYVQFHDEATTNRYSHVFPSVMARSHKWKQLQVKYKYLICKQCGEISSLSFPLVTIGFRKLVLLNWPTFRCGDRKLHLRHVMLHIQVTGKCLKSILDDVLRKSLTKKTLSRTWMNMNMQRIWENNAELVVKFHVRTARIPRKGLFLISLWL